MLNIRRTIKPEDLMPLHEYDKIRHAHRKSLLEKKLRRRIHVGPYVTFHFENYDTMWAQVQEMLYIEKGGEEQISDELEAYNPLIPQGRELVATMLIEIEDDTRRQKTLAKLGHIEDTVVLSFGGHRIFGMPEDDVDRTTDSGKTSAVHFITFTFTDEQADTFKSLSKGVALGIEHKNYGHSSAVQDSIKDSLANDLD